MIDYTLAEVDTSLDYPALPVDFSDSFFSGFIVKNRYDEERYKINNSFEPVRFTFPTNNGAYKLYGRLKQASPNHKLISSLNSRDTISVCEYSTLLNSCGLSCLTCFLHFSPGLYPVDDTFMSHFFPEINEAFIDRKNNIPVFQRMGNIYLFALINHNKK
jgi:hypothetical protein